MQEVRILLVEDEPLWQEGIRALISTQTGWTLDGVADDYETAVQLFESVRPDVVLLDWNIKGEQDGLAVGQWLEEHEFSPDRIILVSGSHPSVIPKNPYAFVPKHQIGSLLTEMIQRVTKN